MKSLMQILGLKCRHPYLSLPLMGHRTCNACGQSFPFTSYTLSDEDKAKHDHYTTRERSISRVFDIAALNNVRGNSILRFRRKGKQR